MADLKREDFNQELLILFDAYVHGSIDRRAFLDRAARFAVGGATAAGLLAALSPKYAEAQRIPPDDARLRTESVSYPSPSGHEQTRGYLVRTVNGDDRLPGVLVIHENRGLNPHIEDVARRVALEGFLVFAPDALAPLGGYPGDEDQARERFATLDQAKTRQDMLAAAAYLKQHPACTGRVGAVGFCWGGGITMMLATQLPDLGAAVPFYGNHPAADQAVHIRAPMMIHYAEHDPRINGGRAAWEAALQAADIAYTAHSYPGAQHGFHNDTTPRYDEAAAQLAWERTITFFREHLGH